MGPFWNPLRGESLWRLSPFTGVVTLMRLPHREKDEEDHIGAAGDLSHERSKSSQILVGEKTPLLKTLLFGVGCSFVGM